MNGVAPVRQEPSQPVPKLLAQLPGGLSPVDLWLNLHTAQQSWGRIEDKTQRDNAIASARLMLESLSDFPVSRWLAFNHAIGWIPAAIAAVTWCRDATLAQCVAIWSSFSFMPVPEPGAVFAARLVNPALLPGLSFNALVAASENDLPAAALLIAARDEAPVMDMDNPRQYVRELRPELVRMLALRGAIPPEWVSPTPTAATQAAPVPQKPAQGREPEHLAATMANMLKQRKTARNWSEEEIAAAFAIGNSMEVTGFPYGKAFRFSEPGSPRSVVADENGRLLHVGREDYVYSDTFEQSVPAELPPMTETGMRETAIHAIHVPLKGEFIDVWRPVEARRLRGNVFQIADRQQNTFNDEVWGTTHGPRVECEARLKGDELMLFFKRAAETW